jgi:murein DD-endopeptidase MepM/ murein hydrolase activator NlpD
MKRINRKANFLVFFLSITSIIIFTSLYIALYNKGQAMTKGIGYEQFRLFDIYSKGEKALMYVDISGRYAEYDTIMALASKGGLMAYSCGSEHDFPYWYKSDGLPKKECYPTEASAMKGFSKLYPDLLDPYLSLSDEDMPSGDEYVFTTSSVNGKTTVVGKTDERIRINEGDYSLASSIGQIDLSTGLSYPIEKLSYRGFVYMVSSCFGRRLGYNNHKGIDFGAQKGTPVYSISEGKVTYAKYSCPNDCAGYFSGVWDDSCDCGYNYYGNYIIITHSNGLESRYAHLDTISVSSGQQVSKGQQIATVGNTGHSSASHLHFEIRKNAAPLNPLCFYDTSKDFVFDDGGDGSCSDKLKGCTPLALPASGTAAQDATAAAPVPAAESSDISYSVNPSFIAAVDYDFSGYEKAVIKAQTIVDLCKDKKSYSKREDCVSGMSQFLSNSEMTLDSSCYTSPEFAAADAYDKALERFLLFEQKCIGESGNPCYCKFNQADFPNLGGITGLFSFRVDSADGKIYILTIQNPKQTNIRGVSDDFYDFGGTLVPEFFIKDYTYTAYYDNGRFQWASIDFLSESGEPLTWDLSEVIIYKSGPYSIIVKREAFYLNEAYYLGIGECSYPPETYYFCAKDFEHTFPFYNSASGKVENKNPEIRFALQID